MPEGTAVYREPRWRTWIRRGPTTRELLMVMAGAFLIGIVVVIGSQVLFGGGAEPTPTETSGGTGVVKEDVEVAVLNGTAVTGPRRRGRRRRRGQRVLPRGRDQQPDARRGDRGALRARPRGGGEVRRQRPRGERGAARGRRVARARSRGPTSSSSRAKTAPSLDGRHRTARAFGRPPCGDPVLRPRAGDARGARRDPEGAPRRCRARPRPGDAGHRRRGERPAPRRGRVPHAHRLRRRRRANRRLRRRAGRDAARRR